MGGSDYAAEENFKAEFSNQLGGRSRRKGAPEFQNVSDFLSFVINTYVDALFCYRDVKKIDSY